MEGRGVFRVTDIWDVEKKKRRGRGGGLGSRSSTIGWWSGFVLKVLMVPPSTLLNLLLQLPGLNIYKQTGTMATCLSICSFAGD